MKLSKINLLLVSGLVALALWLPQAGTARAAALPDLLPACVETGACRICDIVNVFVTLGRWLIAGAAGLALLVIVFAGTNIVTSAGNADKVGAAKKQIVGAVLGLGLVLVAFQLVAFIIFVLSTPAAEQNFDTSQVADTGKQVPQNLGSFLGIPWWKICDVQELLAKEGKGTGASTASCLYWGDGTICDKKNTGSKKCCQGECTGKECKTTKIVEPVAGPSLQTTLTCPNQTCGICNPQIDRETRNQLENKLGIKVNKAMCSGNTSYKDTPGGCTTVGGLPPSTLANLAKVKAKCESFTLTGGTECGHASHGYNKPVVDISLSASLIKCMSDNRRELNIVKICTTAAYSQYSFGCGDYKEDASHIHAEFRP